LTLSILDVYMRRSDEMGEAISREMGAPVKCQVQQSGTGSFHPKGGVPVIKDFEFRRESPCALNITHHSATVVSVR
jgi:aldehyde dehydrogenase (NAD+)